MSTSKIQKRDYDFSSANLSTGERNEKANANTFIYIHSQIYGWDIYPKTALVILKIPSPKGGAASTQRFFQNKTTLLPF
jgi:hypothetical protein